jgi:hypothetical protein
MTGRPTGGAIVGEILAAGRGILEAAAIRTPALRGATLEAIGWATVELERAGIELSEALPAGAEWRPGPRDEHLGARTWVGASVALPAGAGSELSAASGAAAVPTVVLLEPDTEGRLAAFLARHGEGVAAVYIAPGPDVHSSGPGPRSAALADGPFGPARLLPATDRGPAILVLDRPVVSG